MPRNPLNFYITFFFIHQIKNEWLNSFLCVLVKNIKAYTLLHYNILLFFNIFGEVLWKKVKNITFHYSDGYYLTNIMIQGTEEKKGWEPLY
jgi:hypothetical protein